MGRDHPGTGGAGSTAAGLRAGRPTQIVPFLGDQPFWSDRGHELGAGPPPLARGRLGRELAGRLGRLVGTPSYDGRAAEVGERIRAEDGPGTTRRILERIADA
ncbi:glycosyltransferase [Brevibacterium litoralis]|uniref:glycosyltransferase n=1 Tax=Brevibacterium litoralis TaxID=3138935 RepID=UPI0032EC9F83